MKKVLSLLAIVTLFTFVACNNAEKTGADAEAETEATTEDQNAAETMEEAEGTMEKAGEAIDNAAEAVEDGVDAVEDAAGDVAEEAEKMAH